MEFLLRKMKIRREGNLWNAVRDNLKMFLYPFKIGDKEEVIRLPNNVSYRNFMREAMR